MPHLPAAFVDQGNIMPYDDIDVIKFLIALRTMV
jgi:hypothetical protein